MLKQTGDYVLPTLTEPQKAAMLTYESWHRGTERYVRYALIASFAGGVAALQYAFLPTLVGATLATGPAGVSILAGLAVGAVLGFIIYKVFQCLNPVDPVIGDQVTEAKRKPWLCTLLKYTLLLGAAFGAFNTTLFVSALVGVTAATSPALPIVLTVLAGIAALVVLSGLALLFYTLAKQCLLKPSDKQGLSGLFKAVRTNAGDPEYDSVLDYSCHIQPDDNLHQGFSNG